jgi:3-isopropylmalate/(R)-2-methylmalate dehydratase small subunit
LARTQVEQLMLDSQRNPSATLRIDIERQVVESSDGRAYSFPLGERHKRMVIEGLDTIGMTLANLDDIKAFERTHQSRRPWAIVG